jgi:hypothetical protein
MVENIDVTLLAKLCQDTLAETKAIRRDLADVQRLAVRTVDVLGEIEQRNAARSTAIETRLGEIDKRFAIVDTRFAAIDTRFAAVDSRLRGIDQRIGSLKGELELTIKSEVMTAKSELMTALGNFEARMVGLIEQRLGG